jgi:hypothetical protein
MGRAGLSYPRGVWVTWLRYQRDDGTPATEVEVTDTPWYWAAAEHLTCWLSGRRLIARFGFALLQWTARRADAASTVVFSVPVDDTTAERVREAVEVRCA